MSIKLAGYIDHTLLKASATPAAIETLCQEAREHQFATVCVNPCYVAHCQRQLDACGVGITTVIGFPLGANKSSVKVFEAVSAIEDGATEIDMVVNIGNLLAGNYKLVEGEIVAVAKEIAQITLKVIIETAYLTDELIVLASRISQQAGANYVKTSTGFAPAGAKSEHIRLMRQTVGPDFGVKASGGISSRSIALAMIEAGANRLGASAGIAIIQDSQGSDGY